MRNLLTWKVFILRITTFFLVDHENFSLRLYFRTDARTELSSLTIMELDVDLIHLLGSTRRVLAIIYETLDPYGLNLVVGMSVCNAV